MQQSDEKINVLCWLGWYRTSTEEYGGIFIKKHIELLQEFAHLHCFHIKHTKELFKLKKTILKENFGDVIIYHIPAIFPLKIFFYLFLPFYEGLKFKQKQKKIDVFYLNVSYPFIAFTFLLDALKIKKWLLTEHWSGYTSEDNKFDGLNFFLKKIIKIRLKKLDKISVVSEYLKNSLIKRFPFLSDKISIIPNVIHYPDALVRKNFNQHFQLLTISNLNDYYKNISFLIDVIYNVSQKINIQMDIYGDGIDKDKLIQKTQTLGLLNKVIFFKGRVKNTEISKVYSQYHAFILLSRFETFSVVTAEAIAHGLPVIVSKCGGPEEYINEKNGILVPVNSMDETINAILQLYNNYHKFSPESVQSTILNKFNKSTIKHQLKKFLLE